MATPPPPGHTPAVTAIVRALWARTVKPWRLWRREPSRPARLPVASPSVFSFLYEHYADALGTVAVLVDVTNYGFDCFGRVGTPAVGIYG